MNVLIFDSLKKLTKSESTPSILDHQLGSIDFLYKNILYSKRNILLFHKMGSGKTIISLLLAFLLSKKHQNIIILLPNNNIKNLWISKINIVKQFMPFQQYNSELITFKTKKEFIDNILLNKENSINLKKYYTNTTFIIDEAHNFFGNTGAECILFVQNLYEKTDNNKPLFILVTGSPMTNTLLTLKDLLSIITYEIISENDYMVQEGNKIFNFNLTDKGIQLIKHKLINNISYYNQDKSNLPSLIYKGNPLIKLPIIPCIMSKEQTNNYYEIKNNINNEMFLKYLLDVSFTAMGSIHHIQNFENFLKSKKKYQLTDTLYLNNGKFFGSELKTLQNSCKIKYFVEQKIYSLENRNKTFIYFANSRIGGRFLKDMLYANGIQEYGEKKLDHFLCYYCGSERKCQVCKPLTYIIITSIYLTTLTSVKQNSDINDESDDSIYSNSINSLLDIYNSDNNQNGEEICFLFGSKIISESYTLKETRDIWFLTIPDSLSEMSQIISRCLRTFSYKDISLPVKIFVLTAITKDFKITQFLKEAYKHSIKLTKTSDQDLINDFINLLMEKNEHYPYDLKKVLYLEIKSKPTNLIHNLFKKLSSKYKEEIADDLIGIYIIEVLRRLSYQYSVFNLKLVLNSIPDKLLDKKNVKKYIEDYIEDGLIVYNKILNQCFLTKYENKYYTQPIKIFSNSFLYKIDL